MSAPPSAAMPSGWTGEPLAASVWPYLPWAFGYRETDCLQCGEAHVASQVFHPRRRIGRLNRGSCLLGG